MKRRRFITFLRKTVVLLSIVGLMGAGLIYFNSNRLTLMHQHPYFANVYVAIARYKAETWWNKMIRHTAAASAGPQYATSVPVLVYHGIRPGPEGENISIDNFASQLITLKKAGWQTISIQDYYDFMRHGKKLPAKSFVITFDDGRKDSFYPVDPLLRALHYRATMFVITKSSFNPVENKFYLDKQELSIMQGNSRWDLQPHAAFGHYLYPVNAQGKLGHFFDNKLWLADQSRLETDQEFAARTLNDLRLAKTDMQQQLGSSGIAFAFPFNEFGGASLNYPGAEVALMANVKSVYPIAFYQIWPNKGNSQNYPQDPSYLMKRILIDSNIDNTKLLHTLEISSAKSLPYGSTMTRSDGEWLSTWGQTDWSSQGLTISASRDGDGAAIFLDGGGAWQNYLASAHLKLLQGQWARILGRFHDDKNYTSCTYSGNSVLMEETVNGETHILQEVDMPVPVGDFRAELGVNANNMECKLNGETVTYSDGLSSDLSFGGIGFSSYEPSLHHSQVQISDVKVDTIK